MPKIKTTTRAVSKAPNTDTKLASVGAKLGPKSASRATLETSKGETSRSNISTTAKLEAQLRRLAAQLARAKRRIAELESHADTDFLLGVLNRRGFERELNRAIAYIRRYNATGALIVLDVDRLKPINDTFGHAAGDAVLRGIVNVMQQHVRASDVVGRLGGDEFAVLLWNLSETDARLKAEALEQAIDLMVVAYEDRSISPGASAGVASITPQDDLAAALARADLAMYERKKSRRQQPRP